MPRLQNTLVEEGFVVHISKRPGQRNRTDELSSLRHVEPQTVHLHVRALESFELWLESSGTGLHLETLTTVPLDLSVWQTTARRL